MHIDVQHAELQLEPEQPWWCLAQVITPDDGREPYDWAHFFPLDIFEWRVAEYDIDPDDRDLLLTVVLYEPYAVDPAEGLHPLAAADIGDARRHLLDRIDVARAGGRLRGIPGVFRALIPVEQRPRPAAVLLESGAEDPLEVVKRETPVSPEHIEVKRELLAYHRQYDQLPKLGRRAATWQRETPEALRRRIMPVRGNRTDGQ